MPTSSNDQNNNIKSNYSWKLAGGEVNDPLVKENASSHGPAPGPRSLHTRTPRAGRWKDSGSIQSAVARMASSAPRRPPTRRRSASVPRSGGSGAGTRTGPGSQESGHDLAAARAALESRFSQPAPRAWSSARGYRASTASRAPSARRRRGRPRASPRSREPLKGGSKGVGLGQARGAVAAAARAWGECTSAGNGTDLWDLMLEDTWTRRKVKPPPGQQQSKGMQVNLDPVSPFQA